MAAAREMLAALKAYETADQTGISPKALRGLIRQAIEAAEPPLFKAVKDAKVMFSGTNDECFVYIQNHQGQSVDYALKYGGWRIDPYEEGVFT